MIRLVDGDVYLDLDDQTQAAFALALDDATRDILQAVERETRQIYDDARAAWPVSPEEGQHSRDTLSWRVDVSAEAVVGRVAVGAGYARYIQSWQIRPGRWPEDGEVRARREVAARVNRTTRRTSAPAARSGSAVWVLLRWPEVRAGKELTTVLRPLIESALQRSVDGR